MKSRRRKIITRVIVFLLLGAIVNVAVAWGCATQVLKGVPDQRSPTQSEQTWWSTLHWSTWKGTPELAIEYREFGVRLLELQDIAWHWFHNAKWLQSGWPMLSVDGQLQHDTEGEIWIGIFRGPFDTRLPLIPIWPGFAINTIFYAAILWLLSFAPGSVRRMLRRRRGLCPACAYPVGTSPVCTECGKPVTLRRSEGV